MQKKNLSHLNSDGLEELKTKITTTMAVKDYKLAQEKGWGFDELIREGIRAKQELPGYLRRINDMESANKRQGDTLIKLNAIVANHGSRIEKLEIEVMTLKNRILKEFVGDEHGISMEG